LLKVGSVQYFPGEQALGAELPAIHDSPGIHCLPDVPKIGVELLEPDMQIYPALHIFVGSKSPGCAQ
jgi:hypothetical protein